MKILIASDKFKGTFSSKEIGEMIDKIIKTKYKNIETEVMKVSDGGDGLIDAIRWRNNFSRWEFLSFTANKLRKTQSKYLYNIYNSTAIIESATTIGLSKLRKDERNIMTVSSYGLGYDIARLLEVRRPKKLIIGVGGTATNDLFLGGAEALGFKFLDKNGNEVEPIPINFMNIEKIIEPEIKRWENVDIFVATDVTNPLCGDNGASKVFAPQKGATIDQVEYLDKAIKHIAELIVKDLKINILEMTGAGAGGGIAGGIIGLLGGTIIPGADFVLETSGFDSQLSTADLVITGEGCFDNQSLQGKITHNIIERCKAHGKPVAIICGLSKLTKSIDYGKVYPLFDTEIDLQEAKKLTKTRMEEIIENILSLS